MLNKVKLIAIMTALFLVTAISTAVANNPSRDELPSIVGIAQSNDSFDTLVTAVVKANLVDALNGTTGKLTVLAPTDDAFAKLPPATLNAILADQAKLQSLLLYHVISGDVGSGIAATLSEATTLNGEKVSIKVFKDDLYFNDDSKVIIPNVIASNGTIHAIDTVLIPPSWGATETDSNSATSFDSTAASGARADMQNIAEIASGNGSFDTLVAAAKAANLIPALADESGFITVFAPTDEAFAKLPAGTVEGLLANPTALKNVLLYHVVSGDVGSGIAATLSEATTLNGEKVNIKVFKDDLYLNDESKVTTANIIASNGTIHVIDNVLIPPSMQTADNSNSSDSTASANSGARADFQNIAEIASGNSSFDTLVAAAKAANLIPALSDESGFITVFAPTDEAFAKLPAGTIEALLANPTALKSILLYHVVSGDVGSGIAATLTEATTLNGEKVNIKVFSDDLYLNDDSKVITPNIIASNGTIHVIDTVLIPPSMLPAED